MYHIEPEISTLTGTSLFFTLCLGFLLLVLPRRYALAPLLVGGCYMTLGQVLIIGGLHFYLIRILIFFGFIRIFAKKEIFSIKLNSIDKVLIAWVMVSSLLIPLFGGTNIEITERLGGAYNTLGIYIFVRALVRDLDDVVYNIKILGIIIIPLAVLFAVEHMTGKNPFSALGGVPVLSEIRDGRIRCQGPFRHSILAGTFGATALPLFVGLWLYNARNRLLVGGAILAATAIVAFSASSGPLLAYMLSIVGLFCWIFRSHMKKIRWGLVILLLALQVVMKAPVWFVISRLSDVVGGGGWYRSALIDAAVRHFNEWWLFGTGYTASWMPTGLAFESSSADMTNQFIAQGVSGGILSMGLFIWLIVECFKITGKSVRNETRFTLPERLMIWSMGCAIFGHVASFFSVSYFDQIIIFWYMIIAMIAALVHDKKLRAMKTTEPYHAKYFRADNKIESQVRRRVMDLRRYKARLFDIILSMNRFLRQCNTLYGNID